MIGTIERTSVRRLPKEVSNNENLPGTWLRYSTVLYLDGAPRYFQDFECSGTQSWRRVHGQTAEILHKSEAGAWTRLVLRTSATAAQLVLAITKQHAEGRRVERRLVLEKQ